MFEVALQNKIWSLCVGISGLLCRAPEACSEKKVCEIFGSDYKWCTRRTNNHYVYDKHIENKNGRTDKLASNAVANIFSKKYW